MHIRFKKYLGFFCIRHFYLGVLMIFLFTAHGFAQVKMQGNQFLNGYIINNEADTLVGVLEVFGDVTSCKKVHFKNSMTDEDFTVYEPTDLMAYKRKEDVFVRYKDSYCLLKSCSNNNHQTVFIKLIKEDILNVFMYAESNYSNNYYAIKYIPLVQKKGYEPIPFKNKKHIKQKVSAYFSDYPKLAEKLKDYDYKNEDFDKMVEDYTKWSKAN